MQLNQCVFARVYFSQNRKANVYNGINIFADCREEESRKAVKTLQRQLVEVRKQKEQEIQVRNS
jgi:hypothetical protein